MNGGTDQDLTLSPKKPYSFEAQLAQSQLMGLRYLLNTSRANYRELRTALAVVNTSIGKTQSYLRVLNITKDLVGGSEKEALTRQIRDCTDQLLTLTKDKKSLFRKMGVERRHLRFMIKTTHSTLDLAYPK